MYVSYAHGVAQDTKDFHKKNFNKYLVQIENASKNGEFECWCKYKKSELKNLERYLRFLGFGVFTRKKVNEIQVIWYNCK